MKSITSTYLNDKANNQYNVWEQDRILRECILYLILQLKSLTNQLKI